MANAPRSLPEEIARIRALQPPGPAGLPQQAPLARDVRWALSHAHSSELIAELALRGRDTDNLTDVAAAVGVIDRLTAQDRAS